MQLDSSSHIPTKPLYHYFLKYIEMRDCHPDMNHAKLPIQIIPNHSTPNIVEQDRNKGSTKGWIST